MADLSFAQSPRPSYLRPILGAAVAVAIAVALSIHFFPSKSIQLTMLHTDTVTTHVVFKSESIAVGAQVQDDLYVVAHLRIDNPLSAPIFLKDFNATLTEADGTELTASATQKQDLAALTVTFPALHPFVATPLLRESTIAQGTSAQGDILLHFPITQSVWDTRKSAVLTIETYHQPPVTITIPTGTPAPPITIE